MTAEIRGMKGASAEKCAGSESQSRRPSLVELTALSAICVAYALLELRLPINHDVAWLLDAGSRWSRDERLYVDLIEVNPPLVFYLYWIITVGAWTKLSFIAGTTTAMWLMGIWAIRLNGRYWGIGSVAVALAAGAADFGQREQFALVAAIPYLFASKASTAERGLIGLWAFAGLALKPHLLLIPMLATLGRMLATRSWRPIMAPENLVLGLLCIAYLASVWFFYPEFFNEMVPLGNLVYFAYGTGFHAELPVSLILIIALIIVKLGIERRELWPFAGAIVGAFMAFVIQGKFWSYHLVPALGLTLLYLLMLGQRSRAKFGITLTLIFALGSVLLATKRRHYADHVPPGAKTVLFLSAHVWAAYPAVVDRGVRHASHYPAFWTLPGAWRRLNEPLSTAEVKRKAALVILQTRKIMIEDIVKYCPDPILVDARPVKPYFKYPFDYVRFLKSDPRFQGYYAAERDGVFLLFRRNRACDV